MTLPPRGKEPIDGTWKHKAKCERRPNNWRYTTDIIKYIWTGHMELCSQGENIKELHMFYVEGGFYSKI